jgi:hypothetical protein
MNLLTEIQNLTTSLLFIPLVVVLGVPLLMALLLKLFELIDGD